MLNKNTLDVKKVQGQSEAALQNRYVRPKSLTSVEAKKLLVKNLFNYLNDIAYFHNYDWLCHLATFINNDGVKKVAK